MLYTQHHGWLVQRLRLQVGCSFEAADLAQSTFLRVLCAPAQEALREPRAYLTTIARHLLVNALRRRAIERACLDALAVLPEALAPSPQDQLEILQTLLEIDRRLERLPAVAKRAFLLAQLEGLTHGAIARTLDISVSSVKRYLARAAMCCFFPD